MTEQQRGYAPYNNRNADMSTSEPVAGSTDELVCED